MINVFFRRIVFLLFLFGCTLNVGLASELPITVWKTASCGCCQAWVDYLADNGFAVTAHNVEDVTPVIIQDIDTSYQTVTTIRITQAYRI